MQLKKFKPVNKAEWPVKHADNLTNVFLSADFLVQQYLENDGTIRLSICTTKQKGSKWVDGITWDQLQEIKRNVGFGNRLAVEVYPEDSRIVNVANMRHLFILQERPSFAW